MARKKLHLDDNTSVEQSVATDMAVRKEQCPTCVFKNECEGGFHLAPGRRAEIQDYVLKGTNQICHYDDNKTICRGGRDYQLTMWYRLGIIPAPTEEALVESMRAAGVEPKKHVFSKPAKRGKNRVGK